MSGDGKRGAGHRPQATAPILDSTCVNSSHPQPSTALRTTMRSSLHVRIFTLSPPRAPMTLRRSSSAPFRMPCKRGVACIDDDAVSHEAALFLIATGALAQLQELGYSQPRSEAVSVDETSSAVTCLPALLLIARVLCSMPSRHTSLIDDGAKWLPNGSPRAAMRQPTRWKRLPPAPV